MLSSYHPGSPSPHDAAGSVRASAAALSFVPNVGLRNESVDICFDGHRVWSTDVESEVAALVRLEWPVNLRPSLTGRTEVSVVRASDGAVVAVGAVSFDETDARTAIVDARGRWLAINKWDNLGVPLESQKDGGRERLLQRAHVLISELKQLGFRPFLSSGSLLGAIRNGRFLPHDDDIDLGNVTDTQHPAALIVESERLERALTARGYTVVRHSHAHLQVLYLFASGELDHHIDIFTAYFDSDGTFNQPFSIRGELSKSSLEPFSVIELEGISYPAPAVPEDWLSLNYGANWRTPDPGFKFVVPEDTRRRFDSWFGTFNLHRDYWEALHTTEARGAPNLPFLERVLSEMPADSVVVDVGAGLSRTAASLREGGHPAIAVDFSVPALFAQSREGESAFVNLNDRHSVLQFALDRATDTRPTSLIFEHVLEGLGSDGKQNAFLLMRWVLGAEAVAAVSFDTDLPPDHTFDDPTSWHLPDQAFLTAAECEGLHAVIAWRGERTDERGRTRQVAQAIVRRRRQLTTKE